MIYLAGLSAKPHLQNRYLSLFFNVYFLIFISYGKQLHGHR